VLNAAEKAQNLTSGLLSFSRKQFIKPDLIRLGEIVDNISELLKRIIGEHIELRVKHHEREFPVLADSHQIEQVLMNLATNAVDAMPVGGILSIETVSAIIDSEYAKRYSIKHGNYMVLSVSDTGTGIDKKDIPQIFEPFFTTKDKSRGTGLGLAIVYGIIKQHGGFINVYSEKGIGSAFKIYLPASGENKSERREHMTSWQKTSPLMGSETILVVEDEGTVREFLKDALEAYGYKVITAIDGEDAIEKYGEYKADIDMLILDFVLPKKNGRDVYNIINTLNPAIKTLFISGYGLDVLTSKGLYERGLEFIEKPIELQTLMSKIRSILNME
jgi:CheY-like chemotaxis protein